MMAVQKSLEMYSSHMSHKIISYLSVAVAVAIEGDKVRRIAGVRLGQKR